ncbi:phospholipid:diacylglycerol acyltransferase [Martiniozyma asiatica (nom. inval.)]|nr:phospholipid:diacylglycerol acyltransferase [Martiniozyma asiatica]
MPVKNRKNKHKKSSKIISSPNGLSNEEKSHPVVDKKPNVGTQISNHFWEKRRYFLLFGIIIGLLTAGYNNRDAIVRDILPPLDDYLKLDSLSLDSLGFDSMLDYFEDWKDYFPDSIQKTLLDRQNEEVHGSGSFSVGKYLQRKGYQANFNVVMVPGVVSTGIESWGLEGTPDGECPSEKYFRKRLWGSFFMLRTMLIEKACWLKHIMLDPETGLDPPGIKLRAAQGFEAADFFVAGYWIWNKVLENLAVIGYGPENMVSASYDWRLSYLDLERRDGYFSKLMKQIELNLKLSNKKTVLVGHSMGSQIIFYFLKWVEADGLHFGNGGKDWVNTHIDSYIDISGSILGTPKAITALLSGEMKDTVQLNAMAVYGLEKFFSRRERTDMLRSFGGIASMLPKGGSLIWGDFDSAPDDCLNPNGAFCNSTESYGNFIRFSKELGAFSDKNLTLSDSIEYLLDQAPDWFKRRTLEHYSYGFAKSENELFENENNFNKWSNPLEVPLPNAPDMKIYCFYGVGNPTERAYYYKEEKDKQTSKLNVSIDIDMKGDSVLMSDGDGTVSLMTHYMCHKWKEQDSMYNPGNSQVTVVELKHQPDSYDIRGGSQTAEHVDILGSYELNELVLKVAAGNGDEIDDVYITKLKELAAKLDARNY